MIKIEVYYKVVPPKTFSTEYAETLEKAREILRKWGDCPNGTPENKAYWKKQQALCTIRKYIEISWGVK